MRPRLTDLALAVLLCTIPPHAAHGRSAPAFAGCPARGDSSSIRLQRLDTLKNRSDAPNAIDNAVTLRAMLAAGNDAHRWTDGEAARITGYVIKVKPGSVESVNCHAHALAHRDTHIEIALSPTASNRQAVIVEVTPSWRAKMARRGIDWSTHALERLKGHRVTVTGWLFFDSPHANAAETTNPNGKHDWRGTAWEIHPVTAILAK